MTMGEQCISLENEMVQLLAKMYSQKQKSANIPPLLYIASLAMASTQALHIITRPQYLVQYK